MNTNEALADVTRLALDTSPIIYFVESHPKFDDCITEIFQRIESGNITAVTSVITLLEVLVQPLQHNRYDLCEQYRELLLKANNLELVTIDSVIAEKASLLRSRYNIRTPDALQLAAAIEMDFDAFLTNDSNFKRISDVRVIVLNDLI